MAGDEINWRRFFDINGLAGLRIEDPKVFEETHATLFRLYTDGLIDGFRIDHVDGLSDPPGYCRRLRKRLDELAPDRRAYLVVEKILGAGEALPTDWGIDGTSGYDFMNEVSAVQHAESGAAVLTRLWHDLTHRPADFEREEVAARREILQRNFEAQLVAVTAALHRLARSDVATRDISAAAIRRALVALLAHFPVYRGYDAGAKRSDMDQAAFARALMAAKAAAPASAHAVLDHLNRWLGGEDGDPETLALRKLAGTRFQQLSAPVAAKAVEDTAFYRYGRLLSRNDVGFDAARLGCSIADFHAAAARRLETFPDSMLATATHDHKRGEDLRARLAVISEMPEAWEDFVRRCLDLNKDAARPDPGDEIMLYQMIVGAWPLQLDASDEAGRQQFVERLAGWQQKALREAKLRTDWTQPNEAYEAAAGDFLARLFEPGNGFLPLARDFIDQIAAPGAVNGLAQAVLKMTVPGMPDFFQGTEFWDFSLVDPDNRRPVDYLARRTALSAGIEARHLLDSWRDGRIKQAVIHATLALRRDLESLFARGSYQPLAVQGAQADRIIAFARCGAGAAVVVVVPRHADALLQSRAHLNLDPAELRDSSVILPPELRGRPMQSMLDSNDIVVAQAGLRLDVLLSDLPVSILRAVDSA
ncbi:malto-oligosyltrehalose synthase [Rhodopila globiformis]|uniref:malto-oligosyltrehalose synthase n=1 Tax=Rhodopila globiformis TaxID=1071 RepID=UPI00195AB7A3|nr:malto-oligosyltrehalose synthase [Rhodopila globiformis]